MDGGVHHSRGSIHHLGMGVATVRAFRAPTLTDLHRNLCSTIVHSPADKLDIISSVDVQIHNTISEAESMKWDFDLKSMWLTKSRWTMMVRQYLDPSELQAWIETCTGRIGTRGRGIAVLRTKTVAPRGGAATGHTNKETRRWGACMLALSYKAMPRPQITLYSRTSYLGYLAALDLSVAWMCGRYLAKAMGVPVESISFVWVNEALQYHNFKSMAFLLNHPEVKMRNLYRGIIIKRSIPEEYVPDFVASPALQMTRRWMQNVIDLDRQGKTLGDMNYNTYRRIRRRYHTEVRGHEYAQQFEGWSHHRKGPKKGEKKEFFKAYYPLPSIDVHTLDFSPIGMPIDGKWGVDYDESLGLEDDDDE